MATLNIMVTLAMVTVDKYDNLSIGHFSAVLPPNRFPAADARKIINEQVIPRLLKIPRNYISADDNLSYDARGYAFNIVAHNLDIRAAIGSLKVSEEMTVSIEVDAPDDFSADDAF